MLLSVLTILAFLHCALCSERHLFSSRDDTLIVDTGYARYLGNYTEPFSVAYLGIPYAEPPVGDLRFRAPVPLNIQRLLENDEAIDAATYPDFCIQGTTGAGDAGGAGSEDCLKVNIYKPVNATSRSKRT